MKKELIFIVFIFLFIASVFFYPIFFGKIPFPGDLLAGGINPYNSISYQGYSPGGVPNKAQGIDVIRELYPWKHFVIEMLKKGQIPFWNPYNFSGNPLMANFQSGTFYPLNLIFFTIPFNSAWTIYIFLIPLLSGFFTYLYLREIRISRLSAVFGGAVFAFSSYVVVWIEYGNIGHTLLWLPLALLITEKIINNLKIKHLVYLIIILTTACLAGYIQGYFYLLITLFYYYLIKNILINKLSLRKIIIFLSVILVPFLLSAFQIIPTLELFSNSSRGNYSLTDIEMLLNPWWYAITVIAPDFFGNPASRNHFFDGTYIERVSFFGVVPFILALFAILKLKKQKEIIIFGTVFIFSFILAYDLLFTKFFYLIPIPVISTTVPTRLLSLFVFSGAILSAIGLDLVLKEHRRKFIFLSFAIVVLFLICGWIISIFTHQTISMRNLIYPTIFALLFLGLFAFYFINRHFKYLFIIALMCLTLFDLFRFFHKITPFAPSEYLYHQTPVLTYIQNKSDIWRYWGYGSGHIESNIQLYDHTYLSDGHDALHIKSYAELLSASRDGKIPKVISRSDSEIAPGYEINELRSNNYRQKILNILGLKYILLKDALMENSNIYKFIWKNNQWKIYENLKAAPRAFLTNSYEIIPDKQKIINRFYDKNFDEKKTIILQENPGLKTGKLKLKKVNFIKYSPNEIILETKTDAPSLLFLSDTYYPGWIASIDGRNSRIYIADYAFRAVKVPEGKHIVKFYYEPDSFDLGLKISGLTLIILISLYLVIIKNKSLFLLKW